MRADVPHQEVDVGSGSGCGIAANARGVHALLPCHFHSTDKGAEVAFGPDALGNAHVGNIGEHPLFPLGAELHLLEGTERQSHLVLERVLTQERIPALVVVEAVCCP